MITAEWLESLQPGDQVTVVTTGPDEAPDAYQAQVTMMDLDLIILRPLSAHRCARNILVDRETGDHRAGGAHIRITAGWQDAVD